MFRKKLKPVSHAFVTQVYQWELSSIRDEMSEDLATRRIEVQLSCFDKALSDYIEYCRLHLVHISEEIEILVTMQEMRPKEIPHKLVIDNPKWDSAIVKELMSWVEHGVVTSVKIKEM